MTLKEKIQAELIAAMKSGDENRKSALRMLKAAIMKWEVDGEKKEAQDGDVVSIASKEVKQRKDAIEAFKAGGNNEMAEKEEAEMKILMEFLPEQMSEEAVQTEVKKILAEAGISSKAEMGKAMGMVMGKLKGKADGGVIQKAVNGLLS